MERQIRRLVTHLVFQSPRFTASDIAGLRDALWRNREVYFEGFEKGFDALNPRSVRDLIGNDYARRRPVLNEAIEHRNKIFHGQLTSKSLSTDDLLGYVRDIRAWCEAFADNAQAEIGYDGFARDSFRKSANQDLAHRLKVHFRDVGEYADFIRRQMQRPRQRRRRP